VSASSGSPSFWLADLTDPLVPRKPLPDDADVDVAVVGGGFTGLWTAYYLARLDPSLRILVLERDIAGFGASGRNGGWCSGLFPRSADRLARTAGERSARAQLRALADTVDEVGRVCVAEALEIGYVKGGTVALARNAAQLGRARAAVAEARRHGFGPEDLRLLAAAETTALVEATGVLGGTYTPHCAAIHPARLVRGLAEVVERHGVVVHEQTPVTGIRPRLVETTHGRVRAEHVVRATEAYTAGLPGHRRELLPVYSLMLVTEPLDAEIWDAVGLRRRETFTDFRHLLVYGQRTADGRLAFGGRGAPYHFRSRIRPEFDAEPRVFAELRRALVELFPVLRAAAVEATWGGPLGVPRDWFPAVRFDRHTGLATAGGYVGDGVAAANLAGRTLADLLLGRDTELVRLPWVGHRSRRWPPEPLRWVGVNAGRRLAEAVDAAEQRTGRGSRLGGALERLLAR
jgi:glycine/D-amino acid oxidase-like deaminating enzyme